MTLPALDDEGLWQAAGAKVAQGTAKLGRCRFMETLSNGDIYGDEIIEPADNVNLGLS
ncbi:hypothetical protein IQ254_08925 [Nodosilinea sp. LEGE 07088]|uniref:hypothetical protein n=1 Tax=Nodosilinea sp. LEGE 07088 TaxID=2777968 RepID=UPI001882DCD1|nr:hypothetical protein [Nodosilinea sp. LEGE 07088]MBE9137328.1 hypothetical protein [Nodosilinea sp. LEGE 07088]